MLHQDVNLSVKDCPFSTGGVSALIRRSYMHSRILSRKPGVQGDRAASSSERAVNSGGNSAFKRAMILAASGLLMSLCGRKSKRH